MPLDQTLPFLIFSLVAATTPGPSNLMITATGSAAGIVRGLPCVVGSAAGMASLMFTAALGLGQLILGHPDILREKNWCGAAFLLWLAWKIAHAGGADDESAAEPVGFFGAAFFQWVNPKGWLVLGASLQSLLHDERSAKVFSTVMALALAASVLMIFW